MKFILIRHCETDWNKVKRIQGQTDIPLNDTGREQAEKLAYILKQFNIERIVTSSLSRASETGEIIACLLKIANLEYDRRLVECSHGIIDGSTRQELIEKFGKDLLASQPVGFRYDFSIYGGETVKKVLTRQLEALAEIKNKHEGKTILIIGHGRSLNTLLHHFGQEPNLKREEYRIIEF